jgi:hypothetical protein
MSARATEGRQPERDRVVEENGGRGMRRPDAIEGEGLARALKPAPAAA